MGDSEWVEVNRRKCLGEERLVWLEIKRVQLRAWDNDTCTKVCKKWGEVLFVDDTDICNSLSKRLCIKSSHSLLIFATIMMTVNNVNYAIRVRELCSWTPTFLEENSENDNAGSLDKYEGLKENLMENCHVANLMEENEAESHQKPLDSDPFGLDSLKQICGKPSVVNRSESLEFPPGFSLNSKRNSHDSNLSHKLQDDNSNIQTGFSKIRRLEETIRVGLALSFGDLNKRRWVHNLCNKHRVNFLALQETKMIHVDLWKIRQAWGNSHFDFASSSSRGLSGGLWTPNDVRIMWITVYAPQNLSCKIALWSSLTNLISNWDAGLMIMGDFNEVREAGERHDRFHEDFPNITGLVLEKDMKGFRDLVTDTWNNDGINEVNGLVSFKKKLQNLKCVIRIWVTSKRSESNKSKKEHQMWLFSIDVKIDQGRALQEDFCQCRDSIKILGDIDRLEAKDIAQKAKVKWAFEDPHDVKAEFFMHFSSRFQHSEGIPPSLDGDMPNHLSLGQSDYLENPFSRDEIKRFVWDYGGD
ncbi:RNA-directed DNA polymerase, eukaryota, reverse transcriptase zinc-binding domain protein, partial [Tanacetum coccineum]